MSAGLGMLRRIVRDYGRDDRSELYGQVLGEAIGAGYQVLTVREFHRRVSTSPVSQREAAPDERWLVLRHDIDTDPAGALRFLAHEQRHGVHATYYFRHTTAPRAVVEEVAASGADVGYHYEEPATYAKRRGIASFEALESHRPQIEQEFLDNLGRLRSMAGEVQHASSHGDFVNRRLGFSNSWLLESPTLRATAGIEFEAYDKVLVDAVDLRVSDELRAAGAVRALSDGVRAPRSPVYFLSHPREWFVHRSATVRADAERARDELVWRRAQRSG